MFLKRKQQFWPVSVGHLIFQLLVYYPSHMDLEFLNLQIAPNSKMRPMILFIEHATDELT